MTNEQNDIHLVQTAYPTEYQFLFDLVRYRLCKSLDLNCYLQEPQIPDLRHWREHLAVFVRENKLNENAAVLLLLSLAPFIYPHLFDDAIGEKLGNLNFPKIGGTHGKNFRGFLPTGETAFYLIAGEDQMKRMDVQSLFGADHVFAQKKVLWLEDLPEGEPPMHGRIVMSKDYVDKLSFGKYLSPHFSINFPAKQIKTELNWEDLVINKQLKDQINEILNWIEYNDHLLNQWGMKNRLRKGYRTLFYGPPGTGKTFTAGLLGRHTKKDVYKVDLAMVVSKYIGETEKNLELLFARAEDKGWILFFDEADALFGKRTNVRDAHDKYANQEVSYLLQKIEDYNGLIILATNMKNNIDDAFIRRFNSILKFPMPDEEERIEIWKKTFPPKTKYFKEPLEEGENAIQKKEPLKAELAEIVKKYELSGGNILNVVHYVSIRAANRMVNRDKKTDAFDTNHLNGNIEEVEKPVEDVADAPVIYQDDLLDGIRKELSKDGIPFVV